MANLQLPKLEFKLLSRYVCMPLLHLLRMEVKLLSRYLRTPLLYMPPPQYGAPPYAPYAPPLYGAPPPISRVSVGSKNQAEKNHVSKEMHIKR
jgi:hypothetical protein